MKKRKKQKEMLKEISWKEFRIDAARKIDKIIGIKKKFGYMNRSDSIARTEIGRAFSISRQAQDEEVAEQIPELEKQRN